MPANEQIQIITKTHNLPCENSCYSKYIYHYQEYIYESIQYIQQQFENTLEVQKYAYYFSIMCLLNHFSYLYLNRIIPS